MEFCIKNGEFCIKNDEICSTPAGETPGCTAAVGVRFVLKLMYCFLTLMNFAFNLKCTNGCRQDGPAWAPR